MPNCSHLHGFEKEFRLLDIFSEIGNAGIDLQWKHFKQIAKILSPELAFGAFERRVCKRQLKYIGREEVEEEEGSFFVKGGVYWSTDFNGATYSIQGYQGVIGYVYFELICDCMES